MTRSSPPGMWLPKRPAVAEQEWMDRAACRGMPSDMFFPTLGEFDAMRRAKAVCARCPVRVDCLDFGLDEWGGVWGGLSGRERQALRWSIRTHPASGRQEAVS